MLFVLNFSSSFFFCFLPIFDRGFPYFFFFSYSPSFNWEFSFLFCLLSFFDRGLSFFLCFISRARIVVSWDFGSRLVERMDMIYVRVLVCFRDKMGCPTLFPWHKCNNDDLEILCKTSHACTYVDTPVSNFLVMWC